LDDEDFYWITHLAMEIATLYADNRIVSVLEGGYNPKSLASGVEAHLKALLGLPFAEVP
jgi:acetoin utilization deacetylase AcuC-like enzyme